MSSQVSHDNQRSTPHAHQRNAVLRSHVLVGVVSGVIAALATLVGQSLTAPAPLKLATVDLAGLVVGEVRRLQEEGMNTARAEAYGQAWGRLLDKSVQGMADDYGVVLLVGPSVLAGAPDLTAELEVRLEHEIAVFK